MRKMELLLFIVKFISIISGIPNYFIDDLLDT